MAIVPKTVCSYPGCRRIVIHGRCAEHRHRASREKNRPGDPFYSGRRWRKLRAMKLGEQPLCEECIKLGVARAADEVHHAVPRSVDESREFDWDNLVSLCKSHHSKITASERT